MFSILQSCFQNHWTYNLSIINLNAFFILWIQPYQWNFEVQFLFDKFVSLETMFLWLKNKKYLRKSLFLEYSEVNSTLKISDLLNDCSESLTKASEFICHCGIGRPTHWSLNFQTLHSSKTLCKISENSKNKQSQNIVEYDLSENGKLATLG